MAAPTSHMWYVKAAGGVWGPYPELRVAGFVAEGRVTTETAVSPWAEGPFAPAGSQSEFFRLFEARPMAPALVEPPSPASAPAPQAGQGLPQAIQAAPQAGQAAPQAVHAAPRPTGPTEPLLVWAELSPASTPGFHAALALAGSGATIRPGLWLVRTPESVAVLRNRLSRALGAADALMVVHAPIDQAAWFNLDPARDRELRRLWNEASRAPKASVE